MKTTQLDLLIPAQLPTQKELKGANKQSLLLSINLALQSLTLDCPVQAITLVDRALALLPCISSSNFDASKASSDDTRKYQEAVEYDAYFNVRHVQSDEPDLCLLKSILIAYRCFLTLNHQCNQFDNQKMATQRQGFKTYFLLLARTYNLFPESSDE